MNKWFACVTLIGLCALAAFAQTAAFTDPKAGATLVMGSLQPITWTGSGSASVKLVLVSKNDGMQWNLKSGLAISAGAWSWTVGSLENGKTVPTGTNYLVRMQNMAGDAIIAKTGLFSIAAAAAPAPVAKGAMHRPAEKLSGLIPQFKEMALASLPPPAGTTFAIKKINYAFASEGKLSYIKIIISVNSPRDFFISPGYGDPQYGAQLVGYTIENPIFEGAHPNDPGLGIYMGNVSVKGGSGKQLNYPSGVIPAGPHDYAIYFTPVYNGLLLGLGVFQKMPSGFFEPGQLCRREFFPKLSLSFTASTSGGDVTCKSTIYLVYDTNAWPLRWLQLSGETNSCQGGIQYW